MFKNPANRRCRLHRRSWWVVKLIQTTSYFRTFVAKNSFIHEHRRWHWTLYTRTHFVSSFPPLNTRYILLYFQKKQYFHVFILKIIRLVIVSNLARRRQASFQCYGDFRSVTTEKRPTRDSCPTSFRPRFLFRYKTQEMQIRRKNVTVIGAAARNNLSHKITTILNKQQLRYKYIFLI